MHKHMYIDESGDLGLFGSKSAKIFYIVLEKKKIFSEFLKNNKDKSKGKQLLREDFDRYFSRNLKENLKAGKITIHHSYSHSWSGLQFADLLAWSCFQKFEHNNSEYIDLINLEQEVYHVW